MKELGMEKVLMKEMMMMELDDGCIYKAEEGFGEFCMLGGNRMEVGGGWDSSKSAETEIEIQMQDQGWPDDDNQ